MAPRATWAIDSRQNLDYAEPRTVLACYVKSGVRSRVADCGGLACEAVGICIRDHPQLLERAPGGHREHWPVAWQHKEPVVPMPSLCCQLSAGRLFELVPVP